MISRLRLNLQIFAGNDAAIVRDANNDPAPQYFNPDSGTAGAYEYAFGSGGASRVRINDGDDEALGSTTASAVTDPSDPASVIAAIKGALVDLGDPDAPTASAGGTGSISSKLRRISDTLGQTDDATASAGDVGSISAKLRLVTAELANVTNMLADMHDTTASSMRVTLTGRTVELTPLVDAQQLRTTDVQSTVQIPDAKLRTYKSWDLIFANSLADQDGNPVTVRFSLGPSPTGGGGPAVALVDGTLVEYLAYSVPGPNFVEHRIPGAVPSTNPVIRLHLSGLPYYRGGAITHSLVDPEFWRKYGVSVNNDAIFSVRLIYRAMAVPASGTFSIHLQGVPN